MYIWIYLAAAVALGIVVAVQPLLNAILARATGSPITAATISILVAFLGSLALFGLGDRGDTSRAALATVPWWVYLAGLIGTAFVAGGVVIAPVTGALLFFLCVVGGQLLGAALADHFGAFGLDIRPLSPARLAGLALVLAGVVLVRQG
ncbi:MAG TPA: DMT family transporter [Amaricoccus sp.]|uniref:DMT family transporter n=1 Tax=Amaricoccus sp. TaxID=1872485 RepID=UPI001DD47AE0|nr:DMT family transporter [Amaricoccus sp.]MCB1375150.1 DMT family transporter [Paracoccaceae bacterium]MCC0066176.1 DMT family transporter [Rhodovulum sp.]MCB1402636.1 DMT family transporter [Paracoccaceae bacterium]HPG21704.1 DMT family transporter [Amaricoccus sp.]HRW15356.1 DMT family transporter [Amaricoccus sp.]